LIVALLLAVLAAGCGSPVTGDRALCLRDDYYERYLPPATPEGMTTAGVPVAQPRSPVSDLRVALLRDLPCTFTDLDYRVESAPVVSVSPLTAVERATIARIAAGLPSLHVTVVEGRQSLAAAEAQEGEISNVLHGFRFAFSAVGVDHDGRLVVEIGGVPFVNHESVRRAVVGAAITTPGTKIAPRVTITVEHGYLVNGKP
jgi:hypothetical protein